MRVLVTGGAGFIGSHLADALVAKGHEVVVLDNLSTGRLANLQRARATGRLRFVQGDVRDARRLRDALEGVDRIFHLAASVGVENVVRRPLESLMNNIQGAASVLQAAHEAGNLPTVLFSSSEVYGRGATGTLREDQGPVLGPTSVSRWSYAASKVVDEFFALFHHREHGLPVIVVRCFNTCGPRQVGRYGMVLPRLVEQALRGEPLTVYGDGRQTRCFSFVGDVVRGVLRLAEEPRAVGETFNIGSDEEVSIRDLATMVRHLAASASPIVFVPYEQVYGEGFEDVRRRRPDLTKIRSLTGFQPEVRLEALLAFTIREMAAEGGHPIPQPVRDYPWPEALRPFVGVNGARVPC
jgi:UDP-glucose 4-epimerase